MYRIRQRTFADNENALALDRQRINDEFTDKKHVENGKSIGIAELIKYGEKVVTMHRKQVDEVLERPNGNFGLNICARESSHLHVYVIDTIMRL